MKFVRFSGGKTGLVIEAEGLKVLDVNAALNTLRERDSSAADTIGDVLPSAADQSWVAMIGRWDEVRGAFQTLEGLAVSGADLGLPLLAYEAAKLEAPLASPSVKIFAIGSNSAAHFVKVMKNLYDQDVPPEAAYKSKNAGLPTGGFTVWPSIVVGPEAVVAPPKGTQRFDYEAECAVYVKQGGRYLETVDLWGYTAFNDLSVRDTHLKLAKESNPGPMALNLPKNFETGKSIGPWVVVDEGHDLTKLQCGMKVNGEVRQDWNLSEMITSFDEALVYLSGALKLNPGDMLAGGTGCGVAFEGGVDGPHYLQPGDVVELTLEGAGVLRNVVGAW